MNQLSQTIALSLMLAVSGTWAGNSQCPAGVTSLSYHPLGNSQFSIPVNIDHKGPYEFMVDTGSEMTIIDPSLAAELNLQQTGRAHLISGFQSTPAMLVSPDLIEAGPNMAHISFAMAQTLAHLQSTYPGLRGVLGADFLMGFDILLDRKKQILCLDPTTGMQHEIRGQRIPLAPFDTNQSEPHRTHSILIPVQLSDETTRKLNLKLDSGANAAILFVDHVAHESYNERLNLRRGTVVGGNLMYFRTTAPETIQIGPHVVCGIKFATAVRTSQPSSSSISEDGLLPISLFNRIFISYRAGFVILEPR